MNPEAQTDRGNNADALGEPFPSLAQRHTHLTWPGWPEHRRFSAEVALVLVTQGLCVRLKEHCVRKRHALSLATKKAHCFSLTISHKISSQKLSLITNRTLNRLGEKY